MEDTITEEVEVINSIYENCAEYSKSTASVDLRIPDTSLEVKLWFPANYPDEAPRMTRASGVESASLLMDRVPALIDDTFNEGEVYLFTFIDELRAMSEMLENELKSTKESEEKRRQVPQQRGSQNIERWSISDEIRDRGSVFVGRAIKATSEQEMSDLLDDLLFDRKVGNASIVMAAWRIRLDDNGQQFAEDYDNGGEAGAGTTMLHILRMQDVQNVVVVVTRQFDGTHIGADRFRHIKNCTKAALVNGGFVQQ